MIYNGDEEGLNVSKASRFTLLILDIDIPDNDSRF